MRTIEEIKKEIKNCEYFINSHKEQIKYYTENFDAEKIASYAQKIILIQVELDTLLLVMHES